MYDFTCLDAESAREAIELKSKYGSDSVYVAGGTNLLYLMKRGVRSPKYLINLKNIKDMNSVTFDDKQGLSMGSLVKVNHLQYSDPVNEHYQIIAQSANKIASPQIRNTATVGGNLSQDVWCWYLAEGFKCWMNNGKHCYAPAGDNRYHHSVTGGYVCFAVHPSDLAPALYALDAKVDVAGSNHEKHISIDELLPGYTKVEGKLKPNILTSDEIITAVHVPTPPKGSRGIFLKYAARESFDFALASVALVMDLEGDLCKDLRVVLGGVATKPYRAETVESVLKNKNVTQNLLDKASEKVFEKESPLSGNAYRVRIAKELVRRALFQICSPLGVVTQPTDSFLV